MLGFRTLGARLHARLPLWRGAIAINELSAACTLIKSTRPADHVPGGFVSPAQTRLAANRCRVGTSFEAQIDLLAPAAARLPDVGGWRAQPIARAADGTVSEPWLRRLQAGLPGEGHD